MNFPRRTTFKLLGLALAAASLGLPAAASERDDHDDDDAGFRAGHVFSSTNAAAGNELLVYRAAANGALTLQTRLATLGTGTGTGLGNQGAVTLSGNGRHLFVVNAASNSVSTFVVRRNGVALVSTVDSGGLRPVSVTEHHGIVYVLNAAGAGNVTGFRNHRGSLTPLADSTRALSAASGTGVAQVGFNPEGDVLVVTEKATNKLVSYRVREGGQIGQPLVTASNGVTPFGFAFNRRGTLLVSEAFGGAAGASTVTSYDVGEGVLPRLTVVSASVADTQSAACWVVATPNGRHAFVTNTGSGTISRYAVERSGKITLAQAIAGTSGAGPIDAAVSATGGFLFVLNSGSHTISSFGVDADGTLAAPSSVGGLPVGANGLAAN